MEKKKCLPALVMGGGGVWYQSNAMEPPVLPFPLSPQEGGGDIYAFCVSVCVCLGMSLWLGLQSGIEGIGGVRVVVPAESGYRAGCCDGVVIHG
jgi:hypothetical protein